jgi:hypothetical protein
VAKRKEYEGKVVGKKLKSIFLGTIRRDGLLKGATVGDIIGVYEVLTPYNKRIEIETLCGKIEKDHSVSIYSEGRFLKKHFVEYEGVMYPVRDIRVL